jgi:selenocysteine lyase/cysteine desulfurase
MHTPTTAIASDALIERIRASVIGDDEAVAGPYGIRRVTYADYTASGRSLSFLEDYIREAVLPLYANTHTESSGTGLQTSRFREEARRLVLEGVGGDPARHAVIFCGSGSTAAINRLVDVMGLRLPADLDDRWDLGSRIPADQRPVVFIGPYEHHSNELPWRESIADVVMIREDREGHIDLGQLREELERYAARPLRVGSFSAASNVTGIVSDTRGISRLLHEHGALSFFDFAAAAPYVTIAMDPPHDAAAGMDAVFISPHKFIGGPGTPGVLVARRDLFRNRVPSMPGGGTVAYVNPVEHVYLSDIEHREEGGTPAIVESIRAGLVFGLKAAVGVEAIREREVAFIHRALHRWEGNPAIEILGSHDAERLSIVSFVIRRGGRYLHHNFVVALLNDLFGIQSRGGCSCAGPYGHRLLGIDLETSHAFEREIGRGCDGIKPGWVRVNFNYFISDAVFEFILDAVDLVATDGWRALPDYAFEPATGLWRHRDGTPEPPLSLRDIGYGADHGVMRWPSHRHHEPESCLSAYLDEARSILARLPRALDGPTIPAGSVGADFEDLRWFLLPEDVVADG